VEEWGRNREQTRALKADVQDHSILGKLLFTRIRKHDPKLLPTYEFDCRRGNGRLFMLLHDSTRCESSILIFFLSPFPLKTVFYFRLPWLPQSTRRYPRSWVELIVGV
jgi:hypothetical protein